MREHQVAYTNEGVGRPHVTCAVNRRRHGMIAALEADPTSVSNPKNKCYHCLVYGQGRDHGHPCLTCGPKDGPRSYICWYLTEGEADPRASYTMQPCILCFINFREPESELCTNCEEALPKFEVDIKTFEKVTRQEGNWIRVTASEDRKKKERLLERVYTFMLKQANGRRSVKGEEIYRRYDIRTIIYASEETREKVFEAVMKHWNERKGGRKDCAPGYQRWMEKSSGMASFSGSRVEGGGG